VLTRQSNLAELINAELAEECKEYIENDGRPEAKVLSFGSL